MKAIIDGIELEGSADEIAAIIASLRFSSKPDVSKPDVQVENGVSEEMSDAVAWRILNRKPLSDAQRATFKELSQNHPKWTPFENLQRVTGYSKAQVSGMLGALGRRITATHGYANGTSFLEWDWDYDNGRYNYRLSEPAVRAIRKAGL